MFNIYAGNLEGVIILLVVIGTFAVIGVVAFIIYKVLHPKLKNNYKPSEEEIATEELNRVLRPVDDKDVASQISEYKDEEDK